MRVALRALMANKLRSSLTMLGIIIGVMAVVALLSIGQGAQASIIGQIQGIGANLVFVIPGQVQQGGVATAASAATLTLEDAEAIAATVPDVAAIAPEYSRNAQVVYREQNTNTRVIGTTPEYAFVRNTYPAAGEFLGQSDVNLARRVAVLRPELAQDLFDGRPSVRPSKSTACPSGLSGSCRPKAARGRVATRTPTSISPSAPRIANLVDVLSQEGDGW
jgi:putative ABC transport system permease protein